MLKEYQARITKPWRKAYKVGEIIHVTKDRLDRLVKLGVAEEVKKQVKKAD